MNTIPFKGRSMLPFLKEGDRVQVDVFQRPQCIHKQSVGQVVLAKEDGEWTVHRVVCIKNKKVLKGDWSESYTFTNKPIVWGLVNAGTSKFTNSSVLAKVSSIDFRLKFRFLIYTKKILLFAFHPLLK